MSLSVSAQAAVFLAAAVLGVALGIWYDMMRLVRLHWAKSRVVAVVCDTVFWLVALVSVIGFVLVAASGQMRWYVLLGAALGASIYECTASRFVSYGVRAIVRLFQFIARPFRVRGGGFRWQRDKREDA